MEKIKTYYIDFAIYDKNTGEMIYQSMTDGIYDDKVPPVRDILMINKWISDGFRSVG